MILIFDSMALLYSIKFAMQKTNIQLTNSEELRSEIIFLFMNALFAYGGGEDKNREISSLWFTWDSKKSFRKALFSGYKNKTGKERTKEEKKFDFHFYKQVKTIRNEIIPELGFQNNFLQTGLEADDIIAQIGKQERINAQFFQKIVISRDHDLYQTLRVGFTMGWKKDRYTSIDFKKEYGIKPEQWGEVKAIAGCLSDTVPGVPGVGIKTAIKYLKGELNPKTKAYQNIINSEDLIKRNRKLVVLPHKRTKPVTLVQDNLYWSNFRKVLQRYDIRSLLTVEAERKWHNNYFMR